MEERHFKGKISWPKGARMAVVLSFDFQGGEGVRMVPEGNIYFEDYAQAEYGPKTGIWRLLRVLEKQGIVGNFLICGGIVDRYPEAVRAVISKGHEVAGHGYHHEVARNLSREEEKKVIERTTERIRSFSGKRPMGWRTCTQSPSTLELLMENGYLWSTNSFSHDLPFLLIRDGRKLIELPRHPFGDGRIYGHDDFGNPHDALEIWKAAFDELYEESQEAPNFCPLTFHPYISSRPGRAKALGDLIQYMKKHDGVWIATGSEVARCCLEQLDR